MKKIQKQLEKEKLRVEERRREKAEAKAKRKIDREEAAKNNLGGEKKIKVEDGTQGQTGEVKKEVKDELKSDDDEDVDGVPIEDGEDKIAEKAKFRHPAIPGGLLEAEQRTTVKLALKMQPKKMVQRNNVKKTFLIKKKR